MPYKARKRRKNCILTLADMTWSSVQSISLNLNSMAPNLSSSSSVTIDTSNSMSELLADKSSIFSSKSFYIFC